MKRIITIFTVLSILLAMPVSAQRFVDTEGYVWEEEINLLADLQIIEGQMDDIFGVNSDLTRAEMSTIVLRLMNLADKTSGRVIFSDVPSSHWAFGNITAAYDIGIIKGVDERSFNPDGDVTYAQAVKMLVCALGYEVEAESLGGYPSGYLAKAAALGILKGVNPVADKAVTRGEMCKLVANSVDVELFERTTYGSSYTYKVRENETLLSRYHNIVKVEGQIKASYYLRVGDRTAAMKDEVIIGSEVYKTGDTSAADYVGFYVTAYAKETDSNSYELLNVQSDDKVVTLDSAAIERTKTNKNRIYYDENKTEKYYEIAGNADFIYNGVPKIDWTKEDLFFDTGDVTLISHGSGAFNTVIVYAYKNLVVNSINEEDSTVYFKDAPAPYNEGMEIDTDNKSRRLQFITADGRDTYLTAVSEWDILSVAESTDNSVIRIVRSTKKISGKITEMSDDEVTIDGKAYEVAGSLSGNPALRQPVLDGEGVFYLDYSGKIAAVNNDVASEFSYGYLLTVGMTKGIAGEPEIKVFTDSGEMSVFKFAKVFKFNSVTTQKKDFMTSANAIYDGANAIEQLIRYKTNNDGGIISLETAIDIISEGIDRYSDRAKDNFSIDYYVAKYDNATQRYVKDPAGQSVYIGSNQKMINTKFFLNKCKIFSVPTSYDGDDSKYRIKSPSSIDHFTGFYGVDYYDIDENNEVSAIVIPESANTDLSGAKCIVKSVSKGLDADGNPVNILKVYKANGNDELTYYADDNVVVTAGAHTIRNSSETKTNLRLTDLKFGDIVVCNTVGSTNILDNVISILRAEIPANLEKGYTDALKVQNPTMDLDYYQNIYLYAPVEKVLEGGVRVYVPSPNGREMYERVRLFNKATLWLVNMKSETIKTITPDAIHEGDNVFAYRTSGTEVFLVMYR